MNSESTLFIDHTPFFLLKMHSHYIYSSQHPKVYKEEIFKPSQHNHTKFTLFVHCMHSPLNMIPPTKACLNLQQTELTCYKLFLCTINPQLQPQILRRSHEIAKPCFRTLHVLSMAQEAIALKAEVCWWCFLPGNFEQKPASFVLVNNLLLNSVE